MTIQTRDLRHTDKRLAAGKPLTRNPRIARIARIGAVPRAGHHTLECEWSATCSEVGIARFAALMAPVYCRRHWSAAGMPLPIDAVGMTG